jgi:hypothetical protein
MRHFIAAAAYYLLNLVLFPVTLLGYVIWVGKAIFSGRGSGVSGTAQGPLSARCTRGSRPHRRGSAHRDPSGRATRGAAHAHWPRRCRRVAAGPSDLARAARVDQRAPARCAARQPKSLPAAFRAHPRGRTVDWLSGRRNSGAALIVSGAAVAL